MIYSYIIIFWFVLTMNTIRSEECGSYEEAVKFCNSGLPITSFDLTMKIVGCLKDSSNNKEQRETCIKALHDPKLHQIECERLLKCTK